MALFFIRLAAATLVMSAVALVSAAQAAPPADAIVAMPRFTVEVVGEVGPDVILIPGLATPREVWRPLADALKGRARLHLVELRGFGPGDPGPNAQGGAIAGLVEGLADYIARHKLIHVRVVGHSLGGLAALELAQRKPTGLDGVMIVDALPFIGTLFAGPQASVATIAPQAAAMRDQLLALAASGGAMPPALHQSLVAEGKARLAQWAEAVDLRTVAHALHEDMMTDARSGLPALALPLTVLVPLAGSEADQARTRALYTAAYPPAPDARLVWVADSAHFVMLDQPTPFEQAVRAFLALE